MSHVTYVLVVAFGGFLLLFIAEVSILALARSIHRAIHRTRERRRRTRILFLADLAHLVHIQSRTWDSAAIWLGSSPPEAGEDDSTDSRKRNFGDSGSSPASPTKVHTSRHQLRGTSA